MAARKETIRVAQVLNRFDSGGIEAVVMNYYRHMDRSRVQFDFYFAEDSRFPQEAELKELGAGIYRIPSYTKVLSYQKTLRKAFREKQYQIVHAHLSTMSVFTLFAAWRAGVPVRISHAHSTANWGEGKKTLLKYLLRPFNKIFATHWFACGEAAGRWMYGDKAFDAGKVTVMPNAIETEKFAYDEAARQALREELKIPQDAFVVGHVGRFTFAKNHRFLVEVFAELKKAKPEAWLLLVGEGELEEKVRSQVNEMGLQSSVVFTGVRQDVNKLYSAMDVLCMPSHYEGMPLVAWEAQANGLPCVLSDRMTTEAVRCENACRLPLTAGHDTWREAILTGHRFAPGRIPGIHSCAAQLENYYLEKEGKIPQ